MTIGIIGSGGPGSTVARALASKGLSATISNNRGPASLTPLIEEVGPAIKAGTVAEAASADIVLAAVRWADLGKALGGLPAWNGRIVIDGTNPVEFLDPNSPDSKDPTNPLAAWGRFLSQPPDRRPRSGHVAQDHVGQSRRPVPVCQTIRTRHAPQ